MDDPQFTVWREKIAPLIYDWFAHHNLQWPTQACRFGSLVEDMTYKTRYRVYYSEQTDETAPPTLIMATADVCKPGVASAEVVSSWTDFSKSPYLKEQKVVFHPGEVNKIREIPQHPSIVVTHTDAPELCVWNMDKQPNRTRSQMRGKGNMESIPDLQLTGHEDEALFPLATTAAGPAVASGGNDHLVLVWSLDDHIDGVLAGSGGGSANSKNPPTLACRSRLEGHTKPVEEVCFKPQTTQELASVGDDAQLLFWDCRSGSAPVMKMANAHGPSQDVQCVDWCTLAEHCVATGAQDGSVKVWDLRHMRNPDDTLATLNSHSDAIIRLEWHPHSRGVLASGGEDKVVMLWRIDPSAAPNAPLATGPNADIASRATALRNRKGGQGDRPRPKELIMQHSGHRRGKVVDFQWCPTVPWAIMSVSDDSADEDIGGGSLQMWRPSELLYGDEQQLLQQLEKHRDWIMHGRNPPPPPAPLLIEKSKDELAAEARREQQAAAKEKREAAQAFAQEAGLTVVSAGSAGRAAASRSARTSAKKASDSGPTSTKPEQKPAKKAKEEPGAGAAKKAKQEPGSKEVQGKDQQGKEGDMDVDGREEASDADKTREPTPAAGPMETDGSAGAEAADDEA